jgi:transmembrane sensor
MNPMRPPSADPAAEPAVAAALRALDRAVGSGAADRIARDLVARRRARRNRRIAVGAAAACAVAALLLLRVPAPPVPAPGGAAAASALVTAPARQTLPDGSVAESKFGAEFAVEFTATQRRIVLRAGEAHFAVQKDAARPFVVAAGDVQVRAVGTAFSVGFAGSAVAVLVTEGRVAVATPAAVAPTELGAGERAVVSPAAAPAPIERLTPAASAAHLAWRVPRIEFAATPLAEAIPLFNRHAGTRLALDPALGGLRLSGTLRADDLDALLVLLRGEFGLAAEPQPDGTVALRRR